jgi:hypothetical protein
MVELMKEFWYFIKEEKKWWMLPLIALLVLIGSFILFAESSALAPFIYPFF